MTSKFSRTSILLLLFIHTLATLPPPTLASFSNPISRAQLGLKVDNQLTHLTFYWHDIVGGPNPTAIRIANASITAQSPTSFGSLTMIDDPLTEGPDRTSKLVGQAQGMYGSADMSQFGLSMMMNFAFTEGQYSGSTLSVLGRNQVFEGVREMSVVGGTGAFRFGKGYCQARTQSLDKSIAVVKYDVYVSHSDSGTGTSSSAPALRQVSPSAVVVSLLFISLFVLNQYY